MLKAFKKALGIEKKKTEAEPTFNVAEAGLKFVQKPEGIFCYLISHPEVLFAFSGGGLDCPGVIRTERMNCPAVTFSLNEHVNVTCVKLGRVEPGYADVLQRAVKKKLSGGAHVLEIIFGRGTDQVRYDIDTDAEIKIIDFIEYQAPEAVFSEIPPVSQMVAFLRATLHQRRTVLRSLIVMATRCENKRIKDTVEYLGAIFHTDIAVEQPLVDKVSESLKASGKEVHKHTIAALCILADIYMGRIDKALADRCRREERELPVSEDAASAAERFLKGVFAEQAHSQADLALNFLYRTVEERSVISILGDIIEEGGSQKSRRIFKKLTEVQISDQNLTNDEQVALYDYFEANGKSVRRDTIAAVCLYADFEAGIIKESDIDTLKTGKGFADHSLYAMLSVACAFDVNLKCFCLDNDDHEKRWTDLERIIEYIGKGVIARFTQEGVPGYLTMYIPDARALHKARRFGFYLPGELLLEWSCIDFLDISEFQLFRKQPKPMLACFVSEDHLVRWHLSRPEDDLKYHESSAGPCGFINGFRSYRFYGKAAGWHKKATAEELVGRDKVIAVYINHRGSRKYRFIEHVADTSDIFTLPEGFGSEHEFNEEIVEFPDWGDLTSDMEEPSYERFLGITDDSSDKMQRISLCYRGVRNMLADTPTRRYLEDIPEAVKKVRKILASGSWRKKTQRMLAPAMNAYFVSMLGHEGQRLNGKISVSPEIEAALAEPKTAEMAVMIIVYALCLSLNNDFRRLGIFWPRKQYEKELEINICSLCKSESINVRIIASSLLGSGFFSLNSGRREIARRLLAGNLSDKALAIGASSAMASLVLQPSVELLPQVLVTGWSLAKIKANADSEEEKEIIADINSWLNHHGKPEEIPARANLRGENNKIAILAAFVSRFNRSVRNNGSLGCARRYIVLPPGHEHETRQALYQAWLDFFVTRNINPADMEPELYDDFMQALNAMERQSEQLIRFTGEDCCEFSPWEYMRVGHGELFLRLASLIPPTSGDKEMENMPSIIRLPDDISNPADPGICEVFAPASGVWKQFLSQSAASALHLDWAGKRAYDVIAALYRTVKPSYAASEAFAEEEDAFAGSVEACASMNDLAETLAEAFAVPSASKGLALNILLGVKKVCTYKMPPLLS